MGVVSAGAVRRLEEQNPTPAGVAPARPTEPLDAQSAQSTHDDKVMGRKQRVRSDVEQRIDDTIELDQDIRRNAVNMLGQARMPLPVQGAVTAQRSVDVAAAQSQRRAIAKAPISEGRLPSGQSGRDRPKAQRAQRTLLGGSPEQRIPFRPQGSLQSSVTVI